MKLFSCIIFSLGVLFSTMAQDKNQQLYEAILKSDVATVEKLVLAGADVNYIKELSATLKVSMLIAAVDHTNIQITKLLLSKKANVHWKDGFNTTAIMYAALSGDLAVVKLLVENGANVKDSDGKGNTVLSAAKESENAELITYVDQKVKASGQ